MMLADNYHIGQMRYWLLICLNIVTCYKLIMKNIAFIFFSFFMLYSCNVPDSANSVCEYEKAEVYYVKDPCWREFGFNVKIASFYKKEHRDLLFSKFTITDKDSLNYISRHIAEGIKSASSPYEYWCPRIIVFLHGPEAIDTLITNTYTNDPVQLNSFIMSDSSLSLYLTECVGKHDDVWAYHSNRYFYNGNMHMLTSEGSAFILSEYSEGSAFMLSEYYNEKNKDFIHNWYKVYPSGPLKNK